MGQRSLDQAFKKLLERTIPTPTERNAAVRHRASVESALAPLNPYRLMETGSFHHGTGVRGHSDVDVLVSLRGPRPSSPETALARVKGALEDRFPHTPIRVSRPAIVVNFAGGDERWEVIPGYLQRTEQGHPVYSIPAPGGAWIETAPTAHLEYVSAQNTYPEGGAKGLARLIKAYKYGNTAGFKISSFYLEMSAARHMATEQSFYPILDFQMFVDRLVANKLSAMNDPTGITGRIHAASTEAYHTDALIRLRSDAQRVREARDLEIQGKYEEAFTKIKYVFLGFPFPSRYYS